MDCNEILEHGIYDYTSLQVDHAKSIWLVQHLIKSDYQSIEEAKSGALSADIPLEDIMVGLNFSYDESGYQEFKSYLEKYLSYTQEEQLRLDLALKTINTNVIDAWKECIALDGPHIWVVHTHDPKKFIIGTRFNGDNQNPKITNVSWGTSVKASNGPYFLQNGDPKPDAVIKHSTKYQEITRLTNDPISIIINLNLGSAFTFALPGIPQPMVEEFFERKFDNKYKKMLSGVNEIMATIKNDTDTNRFAKGTVEFFIYSFLGNGGRLDLRCYREIDHQFHIVDEVKNLAVAVTAGPTLDIPEFKLKKNEQVQIKAEYDSFDGIDGKHCWIEIRWAY